MDKVDEIKKSLEELCFWNSFEKKNFFVRYARAILYSIAAMLFLLLLLYRLASGSQANSERDYLNAETNYLHFSSTQEQGEGIDPLLNILNRHNELHPKYDGKIVQSFLKREDALGAKEFAHFSLERVSEKFHSFYIDYSRNTLNIFESDFVLALDSAKELKENLLEYFNSSEENRESGSCGKLLFIYNLLRIAFLEQEIGSYEGEKKAWDEFVMRVSGKNDSLSFVSETSDVHRLLFSNFRENGVSLWDYIKFRRSFLLESERTES